MIFQAGLLIFINADAGSEHRSQTIRHVFYNKKSFILIIKFALT